MPERGAIRQALPTDAATIAKLTHDAYSPWTDLLGGAPIPVTEDYGPRIAAGEVYILDRLRQPAGLLVVETHRDHLMIFSVAVAPEFQGLGLGIHLLRFAEDLARKAGVGEIRLYTNARMDKNIALYKSFGYRETGRRQNPARPGWTAVDMAKEIA
ncbi:MAG: GNAT family N-acetyltransferase [Phyllobacteriaceae bacterium]|nr:GNAT family N-acetyltransferase [Phyllobacteriaceae bacterium]